MATCNSRLGPRDIVLAVQYHPSVPSVVMVKYDSDAGT